MKNLAQLYLFVALTVAPSLAADTSPHPLFNRGFQSMGDPTEAFGLGKRQTGCQANYHPCPNTTKCCPIGSTCGGGSVGLSCYTCDPGQYMCTDSVGFCCPNGSECEPGTVKCRKPCDLGSTLCYGSCCDPGYSCIGPSQPCLKIAGTTSIPITTLVSTTSKATTSSITLVNSPTTIPTTSKAATSSTTPVSPPTTIPTTPMAATPGTDLVIPFTTSSIRSTPVNSNSEPTSPSTTEGENSSNGKEPVKAGRSSSTTSTTTTTTTNGSNALKPGGWLGGFGIGFFFAFFQI